MIESLIEVVDAVRLEGRPALQGHSIDSPTAGAVLPATSLRIEGWALGGHDPPVAVEIVVNDQIVARCVIGHRRPDVAKVFGNPQALHSGFAVDMCAPRTPSRLRVRARCDDQRLVDIGILRTRPRLETGGDLVSVVIPCYNQAHFLSDAVRSALGQAYDPLEILVVDDGSTDNCIEVVRRFPDVRYVRQHNSGIASARNAGLANTRGAYVVFTDADDVLLPGAVQAGLDALRNRAGAAFAFGRSQWMGNVAEHVHEPAVSLNNDWYEELLRGVPILAPGSVIYRRDALPEPPVFDSRIDGAADYDLYYRLAREFPVAMHSAVVVGYRRHGRNMTNRPRVMIRANLGAMRRQRSYVWAHSMYTAAFRAGCRLWRGTYGGELVYQAQMHWTGRIWREAYRDMVVLLRYWPQGFVPLAQLVVGSRRRRIRARSTWPGEPTGGDSP